MNKNCCDLASMDSATCIGRTHKCNICDSMQKPHVEFSLKLAELTIDGQTSTFSHHLRALHNMVADRLSRDWHLDNLFLTKLFIFFYPYQLPASFKISPLPSEIVSFVIGALEGLPTQVIVKEEPKRRTIGSGIDSALLPNFTTSAEIRS